MAVSPVTICNLALSWLGKKPITSLQDGSRDADICNTNYPTARDAVLSDGAWSFATKRYSLVRDMTPPAYGYKSAFVLPPDVIRVLTINDFYVGDRGNYQHPWAVEGRQLLLNETTAKISAVTRVTNTEHFSPEFVRCLAARLASDMAGAMTGSTEREDTLERKYEAYLRKAQTIDGSQSKSKRIRSNWLKNARVSGGGGYAGPEV